MKELNEENLSVAISLGTDICKKLGICCDRRGRVIFQIYMKLEEFKSTTPVISEITDSRSSGLADREIKESRVQD